ncbi:MAG: ATP-grasp domain-containing protein [Candidatus Methanoperedens sp.]|nr:ATP-grasp domain-containing protein [Candidatus Methanoperedens sp.]
MKIMVAECAVGAGVPEFILEGRAMLGTLLHSFVACGHEVLYPTSEMMLEAGTAVTCGRFEDALEKISKDCDAGLVIAPDEMLGDLTQIVEENTVNLGCPSHAVRLCADKLECTRVLEKENIPVPETKGSGDYKGDYVIKPRFGCACEGIHRSSAGILKKGFIATKFIKGEHLSASIMTGSTQLVLTVNRQLIEINDEINGEISYQGGIVPYYCDRNDEIIEVAKKTTTVLGCNGYAGVDIVLGDEPYVVDVNPRPTTSIIGISRVMEEEIADLMLKARFGKLPDAVKIKGAFSFRKDELFRL